MRRFSDQRLLACCLTLSFAVIQTTIANAAFECTTSVLHPTTSTLQEYNAAVQESVECLRAIPHFEPIITTLEGENWEVCSGESIFKQGINRMAGGSERIIWDHDDKLSIVGKEAIGSTPNDIQRIPIASLAHEMCHAYELVTTGFNDPFLHPCSGLRNTDEDSVYCENLVRTEPARVVGPGPTPLTCFYGEDPNIAPEQRGRVRKILGSEDQLLCGGCGDGIVDIEEGEECDPGSLGPIFLDDRPPADSLCPGLCSSSCECETRFVDNCDGTITDRLTALMWEKKDNSGGLHDVDNFYTWDVATTTWINAVNSENGDVGFAGYNDWRIPSVERRGNPAELETIIKDFCFWPEQTNENSNVCHIPFPWGCTEQPCYDPIWETQCPEGCTTTECSCIAGAALSCGPNCRDSRNGHWSSVLFQPGGTVPYTAEFGWGTINHNVGIASDKHVRAVRGPVEIGPGPPENCLP